MGHDGVGATPTDGLARVAIPAGWVQVEPTDRATTQVIRVDTWDPSWGLRPTMTVSTSTRTDVHVAIRVLMEAQANLPGVMVVSIDPWELPGPTSPGRRLVFAHTDGDVSLTTMVWAVSTAAGDVIISARSESLGLHRHHRDFAEAVAGIRLPAEPTSTGIPETGDLARRTSSTPWTEVVPTTDGTRGPIVANPDARILVEASRAGADLRFDATLRGGQAMVTATASPRASTDHDDVVDTGTTTFHVPVSRLALDIARWLGLAPARTSAGVAAVVPISVVMNRLVDPSTARSRGRGPDHVGAALVPVDLALLGDRIGSGDDRRRHQWPVCGDGDRRRTDHPLRTAVDLQRVADPELAGQRVPGRLTSSAW